MEKKNSDIIPEISEDTTDEAIKIIEKIYKEGVSSKDISNTSKSLPKAQSHLIDKAFLNTSKLIQYVVEDYRDRAVGKDKIAMKIPTLPATKKREDAIITILKLAVDKNTISIIDHQIDLYDIAVMAAIFALNRANIKFVSPQTVVRTIYADKTMKVTDTQVKRLEERIDYLSQITAIIDCTKEFRERRLISKDEEFIIEDHLIHVQKLSLRATTSQTVITGYKILADPPVFEYASHINQIIQVPAKLFQIKDKTQRDELTLVIKRALVKRIENLRNPRSKISNNTITYIRTARDGSEKGFFHEIGINLDNYQNKRKKKNNIHNTIIKTLNGFINAQYIYGYRILKERKSITGIKLYLSKEEANKDSSYAKDIIHHINSTSTTA